ncbi:UvrD-helicase domain-containing protein [Candidatus Saccharibacteria bacterium]|nr:UvrD-helicase domain-containing protein [Candidatus Saccharibacteria bacterium]MCB9834536.1 UvrD-helicase domain-containing protein [Candidatus Nomurabacteria bacterium]
MTKLLEGLNPEQARAVAHTDGPLLILAGAGSGKTKTLTHRIAYLVQEKSIFPSNILAVTFTNKAAQEMRTRLYRLLDDRDMILPYLGTFHSIAVKILRSRISLLNFESSFTIFDSEDQLGLIKQAIKNLGLTSDKLNPSAVKHQISSAKNELVTPEVYRQLASSYFTEVVAKIYPEYQKLLRQNQALDFDDLLVYLVRILEEFPDVLAEYQEQFKYVLVDEYQDTNKVQYRLVSLLAAKHKNICVVGDDWQSIYSWRGADYSNILNFQDDWQDTEIIKLERNYRSTQHILDGAHSVILKNKDRSDKKLYAQAGQGEKIKLSTLYSDKQEASYILDEITRLHGRGVDLNDVAILYRTNAQSRNLEEFFIRYNIPYTIVGGTRFYDRMEVKDALAYLKILVQPKDSVAFRRAISKPSRGVGDKTLAGINSKLEASHADYHDLIKSPEQYGLKARALAGVKQLGLILGKYQSIKSEPLHQVLEEILEMTGLYKFYEDGTSEGHDRVENIKELISVAKSYQDSNLADFLSDIALLTDFDNWDSSQEKVNLMTLHSAKGLEFDTVFLVGMEEGLLPHINSMEEQSDLEEERRLCYVGMTRAKQNLYLTHTHYRTLYGRPMNNRPSRFLDDLDDQLVERVY